MANARKRAERSKYSSHNNNGVFKDFEFRANVLQGIKKLEKGEIGLTQLSKNMFRRTTNK